MRRNIICFVIFILFAFVSFIYAQTEPEANQRIETTEQEKNIETQQETTAEATTEIYFNCIDRYGKQIMTNKPVEGSECKPIGDYDRLTSKDKQQIEKEKIAKAEAERKAREERMKREAEEQKKLAEEQKEQRMRKMEKDLEEAKRAAQAAAENAWSAKQEAEKVRTCHKWGNTIYCD
jgi:type IV secretory pathway VirB10-like protein